MSGTETRVLVVRRLVAFRLRQGLGNIAEQLRVDAEYVESRIKDGLYRAVGLSEAVTR